MTEDKCLPKSGPDRQLKYAVSLNRKSKDQRHWSNEAFENWSALVSYFLDLASPKNLQPNKYQAGGIIGGWLRPGPASTSCDPMPCDKRHKTKQTVAFRSFIALDYDGHDPHMPDKVKALGFAALVYWSAGATLDHQKWRIWIQTDRDLKPDEYDIVAYWVQTKIGGDGWDTDSHNYVRTMYLPASTVPEDFRLIEVEGEPLDVDDVLFTADVEGVEPPRTARTPLERPVADLAAPASPEECEAAERLFSRFLRGIEASYLPGDGVPGNCHNTWLGHAEDSPSFGLSGALMYRFAAGGCLDWDAVTERIQEAAESAGWEFPDTVARVNGAMEIGKAEPSRPYSSGEERPEAGEVFDKVDEGDDVDLSELGSEDGPALFDAVAAAVRDYVYLPNETDYLVLTLWVAATYAVEVFETATRAIIRAPEPQCGKTRLLDTLAYLSANPLPCGSSTTAALVRSIGKDRPTVFLDEYDVLFGTKKAAENNEELRGVINNGHARNKPYLKVVPGAKGAMTVKKFDVFAFVALAGIGSPPDTVLTRGLVIDIARRPKTAQVKPFRERRDGEGVLKPLGERIDAWVSAKISDGSITRETIAEDMGVEDRAADNWEPLLIIADAIGGDWPRRARDAAVGKTEDRKKDVMASDSHNALRDLRRVWPEGATRVHSQTLVGLLRDLEESPWERYDVRGLDQNGLSHLLRGYGLRTKFAKVDGVGAMAYFLEDPCHKPKCKHKEDELAECDLSNGLARVWASYLDSSDEDDADPAVSRSTVEAQKVFAEVEDDG